MSARLSAARGLLAGVVALLALVCEVRAEPPPPPAGAPTAPARQGASRGVVVVAVDAESARAARALARAIYREPDLRPQLDDASARALVGEPPAADAPPPAAELAEVRRSLAGAGSDVIARRLLASLGVEAGAALVVAVSTVAGRPVARVLRVATAAYAPIELGATIKGPPPTAPAPEPAAAPAAPEAAAAPAAPEAAAAPAAPKATAAPAAPESTAAPAAPESTAAPAAPEAAAAPAAPESTEPRPLVVASYGWPGAADALRALLPADRGRATREAGLRPLAEKAGSAAPAADTKAKDGGSVWSSPWFWGSLGGVAAVGVTVFVLAQAGGDGDVIHLQGRIAP